MPEDDAIPHYMDVELVLFSDDGPADHLSEDEIKYACESELTETTQQAVRRFGPAASEAVPSALFHALRTYDPSKKVPWLIYRSMIVTRFAVNFLRTERKQQRICKPETSELLNVATAQPDGNWPQAIQNVLQSAGKLTETNRWIFLLLTIGQVQTADVSKILGITEPSVQRSRNDIRRFIKND